MYPSLLTAVDSSSHVHLVIGVNTPLAGARCSRSLEVGAKVKIVGASRLILPTPPSSQHFPRKRTSAAAVNQDLTPDFSSAHINADPQSLPLSVSRFVNSGKVDWIPRDFHEDDLTTLGRKEVGGIVDAVFVTVGSKGSYRENHGGVDARRISSLCKRLRIPVNVTDAPELCSFTLLSAHTDGPLQVGVTTSGRGCKLASRIRREIAGFLPRGTGDAVERLGRLRRRVREEDMAITANESTAAVAIAAKGKEEDEGVMKVGLAKPDDAILNAIHFKEGSNGDEDDDETGQSASLNKLVQEDEGETSKTRRIRWLSQICEYWPLQRLVAVSDAEIDELLKSYISGMGRGTVNEAHSAAVSPSALHSLPSLVDKNLSSNLSSIASIHPTTAIIGCSQAVTSMKGSWSTRQKGTIILAGSGPGHPSLLTLAAHEAIQTADLILADKLVPAPILDLIPRRTRVHIARKFPGNADAAQDELLALGLAELQPQSPSTTAGTSGKTVLRLKQGDPFLFGRGAEEVAFFRSHGHNPIVIPGLSSGLAAPLFASIPPTHRGVADHVLLCTGTGRRGAMPNPPSFRPGRTAVFLMALHRVKVLVESLIGGDVCGRNDGEMKSGGIASNANSDGKHGNATAHLMNGVHTSSSPSSVASEQIWQPWPRTTHCAVIERASCPDQRVIRTTLAYVCDAVEEQGSRPPGLLVVGECCAVLEGKEQKRDGSRKRRRDSGDGDGESSEGAVGRSDGVDDDGQADSSLNADIDVDMDFNSEKWTVEEGYRDLDWVSSSMISR